MLSLHAAKCLIWELRVESSMITTTTIIYLCGPCCMEYGEVIEWNPSVQSSLRPPLKAARMRVQELKERHHRYKDKSLWFIGSQGRSGMFWNSSNTREIVVFFFKSTIFPSFPSTIHVYTFFEVQIRSTSGLLSSSELSPAWDYLCCPYHNTRPCLGDEWLLTF